MKRNKMMIYILFFLLLFPGIVHAEVCNKNDIKIESIELNEIKGNAEEISESNHENNQINLNTKMNVIGDSISYKVVIKNTSNSDYVFDQNQITKNYIHYDIFYENNSNIVKAGKEKTIYLRLNYQEKPQVENLTNGVLTENNKVSFKLINESGEILNPKTKNKIIVALIILILSIGLSNLIIKKNNQLKVIISIISLLIIPQIVNAICTSTLDINLNLEIDAKEATFLPGTEVNIKMKQLAGDDTSTVSNGYNFEDQNITTIKYSEIEPTSNNKEEKNIVSIPDSEYPIYMWFNNGTIYWWSEDKTPSLNKNASFLFNQLTSLNNMDGVETFNTSNTTNFQSLITETALIDLSDLKKWNTSKVTNMKSTFASNYNLKDITFIQNWDVSNVKEMNMLFYNNFSIEEIDLSNWETKSLENMNLMFAMNYVENYIGNLKKITLSKKFDTSKVTDMAWSFYNNRKIEDSFIKYINTSSVTVLQDMFYGNFGLTSLEWFKDWDVSKVTNMGATFTYNPNIKTLNGLENWNVSNVTTMNSMFSYCPSIEDASAINDWNIQRTAAFDQMFRNTPSHPEFTKVEGTWNAQGTFIPN